MTVEIRDAQEYRASRFTGTGWYPPESYHIPVMNIGDLYGEDARAAHEPRRRMTAADLGLTDREAKNV